mgnify:CR=1 FL=1
MTEKKYKKTITKILKIKDKILKKTISLPKTNFPKLPKLSELCESSP